GGSIEVQSEGRGQGSEFIVRLPALAAPVAQWADAKAPNVATGSAATLRVLVVDDNIDSAASLAMLIKTLGHDVHTVHDGLAAVEAAISLQPDLVLLDIGMPGLNGYDAARRIRAQQGDRPIRLIALTGWGQDEDRRRSHEAGFDAHLVKP